MAFSDADLIARVLQTEDPNAFGELVRRYQSPVRAFLRKLTRGDAALVADHVAHVVLGLAHEGVEREPVEPRDLERAHAPAERSVIETAVLFIRTCLAFAQRPIV